MTEGLDGDTFERLDRFPDPVRRPWRAEVQARWPLRFHHVAGRLGAAVTR